MFALREAAPKAYPTDRYFAMQLALRVMLHSNQAKRRQPGSGRAPFHKEGYLPVRTRLALSTGRRANCGVFLFRAGRHVIKQMGDEAQETLRKRSTTTITTKELPAP